MDTSEIMTRYRLHDRPLAMLRADQVREDIEKLCAHIAKLEVDRWLLEHVGLAPRGLARSNCPPDTYGTPQALCSGPPEQWLRHLLDYRPCPGYLHCYREWARRQMAEAQGNGRAIWPNGATDRDGDWLEDDSEESGDE